MEEGMKTLLSPSGLVLLALLCLTGTAVMAVTDGEQRRNLEAMEFGEEIIIRALHATPGKQVFSREKRKFVRGLPRVTLPLIYEPDVYTWELATSELKPRVRQRPPGPEPLAGFVAPVTMHPPLLSPRPPGQVQLTPLSPYSNETMALPNDAAGRMNQMLHRAENAGFTRDDPLRGDAMRQRLVDHVNRPGVAPVPPGYTRGGFPTPPPFPKNLPTGRATYSYDGDY